MLVYVLMYSLIPSLPQTVNLKLHSRFVFHLDKRGKSPISVKQQSEQLVVNSPHIHTQIIVAGQNIFHVGEAVGNYSRAHLWFCLSPA